MTVIRTKAHDNLELLIADLQRLPLTIERVEDFYERNVSHISEITEGRGFILGSDGTGIFSIQINFNKPYREKFITLIHEAIHGIYGFFPFFNMKKSEDFIEQEAARFCDNPSNKRFLYNLLKRAKAKAFYD